MDKLGENVLYCSSYPPLFIEDTYGKNTRFEDAFFPYELPFERGDIVRDVITGKIGVLETSREEWVSLFPKIMSGQLYADASDDVVLVDFVDEDGSIDYDHISIFSLEKVFEFESKEQEELMQSISMLLQGKEMLGGYSYRLKRYVDRVKEKVTK